MDISEKELFSRIIDELHPLEKKDIFEVYQFVPDDKKWALNSHLLAEYGLCRVRITKKKEAVTCSICGASSYKSKNGDIKLTCKHGTGRNK